MCEPIKIKMNCYISLLVFVLALGLAMADVRYRGNAVHPDYPNQCYYEDLKQPIPVDQSYSPLNVEYHCETIFCRSDYVLLIESCGRHNIQPNDTCKIGSDMRKPYPGCCPKLVCQNDNSL